ncbi:MAG TPA: DNA-processing protein DprA [Candidatus Nanopelagicales bacterium]
MDERTARIALACLVEPGTAGVAERVAELGAGHVLHEVLRGAGSAPSARAGSQPVAGRLGPDDVPDMLAAMRARGVRVVVPGDAEWPNHLSDLPEPPLALWVRGGLDLRVAALRSVAVVGSRACTAYGERATAQLVQGLAELGWSVVSGAAFGIDAAAHRAALGVGGPTVAVLACGIDQAYPRAHESLLCRIADHGAVVTELPPGSAPLKHRFLARNRIIAGLTRGTVVVEAARRSGALATANRALALDRPLMAVPGPITAMASSGTNRLLHDEVARTVCSAEEVVAVLLERPGAADLAGPGVATGAFSPGGSGQDAAVGLAASSRAVLAALPRRGGRQVDELAARAELPAAACLAELGLLELAGLVRRGAAGWRRCD